MMALKGELAIVLLETWSKIEEFTVRVSCIYSWIENE